MSARRPRTARRLGLGLGLVALLAAIAAAAPRAARADDTDDVVDAMPLGEDDELDAAPARAAYARQRLTLVTDAAEPYARRGDGRALRGDALYDTLGDPGLLWQYRLGVALELGLYGAGLGALGVGAYYWWRDPPACNRVITPKDFCDRGDADAKDSDHVVGGLIALGGLSALAYAYYRFEPAPIDATQLDRQIRSHNRALRRRLGVLEFEASGIRAGVTPTASPGGLGLHLAGSF